MTACMNPLGNHFDQFGEGLKKNWGKASSELPNMPQTVGEQLGRANWNVCKPVVDNADSTDKSILKFVGSIFEGFELMLWENPFTSSVLLFFQTCSKMISGTLMFNDFSYWVKPSSDSSDIPNWKKEYNKNPYNTVSIAVNHAGHGIDFCRLLKDGFGVAALANIGDKIAKVPVLGSFANLGLGMLKNITVVIAGTLSMVGSLYSVATAKEGQITREFVAEKTANFLSNLFKTILVSSFILGYAFNPATFVCAMLLGITNTWKYIAKVDNKEYLPYQQDLSVAAKLNKA